MNHIDNFEYNNDSEPDMGQLHAIHVQMNAIAKVRKKILSGESLINCEICEEEIPEARRLIIKGCRTCIFCQTILDNQQ